MLKLTLPEQDDFYADCVGHPNVLRVVALSGGYTQEEANDRLRRNHGVVASFSRALVEGLSAQQSDAEFNARLDKSIQSIYEASNHLNESAQPSRSSSFVTQKNRCQLVTCLIAGHSQWRC